LARPILPPARARRFALPPSPLLARGFFAPPLAPARAQSTELIGDEGRAGRPDLWLRSPGRREEADRRGVGSGGKGRLVLLDASGPHNAALRAAALLAVKLGAFYEHKEAPAVLRRCSRSPERRRLGEPCKARGGGFRAALFAVYAERAAVFRDPRQPMKPRPAKPNSSMAHVDGSGTPPVGPPRKPLPL
jgi:hypothetical protein